MTKRRVRIRMNGYDTTQDVPLVCDVCANKFRASKRVVIDMLLATDKLTCPSCARRKEKPA